MNGRPEIGPGLDRPGLDIVTELSLRLQDSLFSRRVVEKPEGENQALQASNSEEERPRSHAHSGAFSPSDRVDELTPGATRPTDSCRFGTNKQSVHKVYICASLLSRHIRR